MYRFVALTKRWVLFWGKGGSPGGFLWRRLCVLLFGEGGEDEAVEGGRGLGGAVGGWTEMEGGQRIGKGSLALLADVAVQLLLILAGGSKRFEACLPFGELHGVGIDGFDLLRERLERPAILRLGFCGLAFIGVLDDIRLLHAVTDTINDLVAAPECSANVSKMGCWIDFCHRKVEN